ncbi:RNA-dependent RNA polymerase [Achlya hypogyna]|uniref:RNA-dependent RNA polymerase n=1 Tax=Achlya hypogyna TaxID=1202772 RepID=A0A1V9Z9A2_ACHHY|nr:RNA-dependent RNA polymerase [Achlya hypogyna]
MTKTTVAAAMAAAKALEAEETSLAAAIATCSMAREAAAKPIYTAVLNNFDYKCTSKEIVSFCKAHDVRDIVRCEIKSSTFKKRPTKRAIVSLTSRAGIEQLLELHNISWRGRPLYVKESKDAKLQALVQDKLTKRMSASALHILPARDVAHTVPPRFTATQGVTFIANGRSSYAFAIEFNYKHRIEFKASAIVACYVGTNAEERSIMSLELRQPPLCYKAKADAYDDYDFDLYDLVEILRTPSIRTRSTSTLWEREESPAATDISWVRTTDISATKAFGYCLCYQLTLPGTPVPDLCALLRDFGIENVYRDQTLQPLLQPAPPAAVPATDWSGGFDHLFKSLPFATRYAVHVLLSQHVIVLTHTAQVERLVAALRHTRVSPAAIMRFAHWPRRRRAAGWLDLLSLIQSRPEPERPDPPGALRVRRVLVTPLRIVAEVPDIDVSNRVLRTYKKHLDRFVRVSFVDEAFGTVHQAKNDGDIAARLREIVHNGFYLAGELFIFLGYSNAQLRSQSCWFYCPSQYDRPVPTVNEIYASLGNFREIPTAGKRGARLGQAFSGTTSAVTVPASHTIALPDVERNGFCFSDGVGTIAPALAESVAAALKLSEVPSAFQIRYAGCKGVVTVDPTLPPNALLGLRPSMRKFESTHEGLEICTPAVRLSCYLNRQMITVFCARGIPDAAFLTLYETMMADLDACLDNAAAARLLVAQHDPASPVAKMLDAGVSLDDRHVFEWIAMLPGCSHRQSKARILVPQAVVLIGVLDETGTLPAGSVFFQSRDAPPFGTAVAVGRNPCLHPGDIQRFLLTDVPDLHHLFDVLVFSALGDRPAPDMLAGGDLDGDIYFCIWDQSLVPTTYYAPMVAPPAAKPPQATSTSMDVVGKFFLDYLMNDNLGQIANTHVVLCDLSPKGACDPTALLFAQAHAVAVDYAKSGVPASVPRYRGVSNYPDFMEKTDWESYESPRVLGQIYRRSKSARLSQIERRLLVDDVNPAVLVPGYEAYYDEARDNFMDYSWALYDIALRFEVKTEIELISGHIGAMSRKLMHTHGSRFSDDALERIRLAVRRVQKEYTAVFWSEFDEDTEPTDVEVLQKAAAWYVAAYTFTWSTGDAPYLSFAWLALEPMCHLFRQATAP